MNGFVEIPLKAEADLRIDRNLANWAAWHRSGTVAIGFQSKAAGCIGGGHIGDFEDMVATADRKSAAIMDVLVNDLVPAQRCAVHHKWLESVYRLCDFERVYEAARSRLFTGMNQRGIY